MVGVQCMEMEIHKVSLLVPLPTQPTTKLFFFFHCRADTVKLFMCIYIKWKLKLYRSLCRVLPKFHSLWLVRAGGWMVVVGISAAQQNLSWMAAASAAFTKLSTPTLATVASMLVTDKEWLNGWSLVVYWAWWWVGVRCWLIIIRLSCCSCLKVTLLLLLSYALTTTRIGWYLHWWNTGLGETDPHCGEREIRPFHLLG